jgi:hypothetical protein
MPIIYKHTDLKQKVKKKITSSEFFPRGILEKTFLVSITDLWRG